MAPTKNRAQRRHPDPEPVSLISIQDASRRLSVTEQKVRMLIEAGDLTSVKLGSRRLIPSPSLDAYIDALIESAG